MTDLTKLTTDLNTIIEALKKEASICRSKNRHQLVNRYEDKSLIYKDVYKKETTYESQYVRVGILKEGNLISLIEPNRTILSLTQGFNWYEPGFYTLESEGIYLRYTLLDSYVLDEDVIEIVNRRYNVEKNHVAGYVTKDGKVIYYDQYVH